MYYLVIYYIILYINGYEFNMQYLKCNVNVL